MKKIIILALLLAFAAASFAQQVIQKQSLLQTDYLKKSKHQKTAAWIMLGGGAALLLTGIIIPRGEVTGDLFPYPVTTYKNDDIKAAIGLTGIASVLGSIPLFIASGKNKRRANAISTFLKTDNAFVVQGYNLTRINYPALSLKISLN